ncbi:hypothetical protein HCN44_010735 [Aphidius gifuensis]|uniref:Uncharacterized protein n=1 Tax=Aphidius gifuensis TaxID=684658 RepID=A0A835CPJ3_APHGI|nr:hypothetical protein HCN44_010735 [Aphidius gifuensis]
MKPPILLLIILLMYFGWINATESQQPKNNSTEITIPEESITIQLEPYKGKVISCKLQVEYDSEFHDKIKYYDASSVTPVENDYIKYIGDENNSCSFTVYPNRQKDFFGYHGFGALYKPWKIVGVYKANSRWDCFFNYDSELESCEQSDIVSVNLHDIRASMSVRSTKIIRKSSSYVNDTITIYAPTEDIDGVYKCSLHLMSTPLWDIPIPFIKGELIMEYFYRRSSVSRSPSTGYEYIGQEDNSCSVRLNNLDIIHQNYMGKYWYVSVYTAPDEENSSTEKKIPEDSITIKVPYETFYDEVYYFDASGRIKSVGSDYAEYIGDKDNSCSFTVYPNRRKDFFAPQHFNALAKPWRIVGLYKANSRWDCFWDYDSDLETCEQLDIVNVNLHIKRVSMNPSRTTIIRKSFTYVNDTITIYAPTEETIKVYTCTLYLMSMLIPDTPTPFLEGELMMQYFYRLSSNPRSPQSGYEYIGQEDNSCSVRLHNLDVFHKNYMNKYWYMVVELVPDEAWVNALPVEVLGPLMLKTTLKYYFFMNSLSWWQNNSFSNVYLWANDNDDAHILYIDPQYF